jgi:hypothetical protein
MEQPHTKSLVPEAWFKIGEGTVDGTYRPFVLVGRNKDGQPTQWRLELTSNRNGRIDWRCVSHTNSKGDTTVYPSPRNLSHSPIDTILRRMCEEGEWVGTEWVNA